MTNSEREMKRKQIEWENSLKELNDMCKPFNRYYSNRGVYTEPFIYDDGTVSVVMRKCRTNSTCGCLTGRTRDLSQSKRELQDLICSGSLASLYRDF